MTSHSPTKSIEDLRSDAAQVAFEVYDFGDEVVEDSSGFEYTVGQTTYSRPIFFADVEDDDASILGHFTVEFEHNSADIASCYASIAGNDVGCYPPLQRSGMGL